MRRLAPIILILTLAAIGRFAVLPASWSEAPSEQEQAERLSDTSQTSEAEGRSTSEVSPAAAEGLLRSVRGASEPAVLGTRTEPPTVSRLLGIPADDSDRALDDIFRSNPAGSTEKAVDQSAESSTDDEPPTSEVGVLVTAVIDGDTIEIEGGPTSPNGLRGTRERVRYIGIDTPESTTEHECYGEEAKARNRELVEGKRVRLVADAEDRDKYGRLLRYVFVDDQFINLALAAEGYATQLTIPPNVAHAIEFRDAVARAREQGSGLWSGCPVGEQNESTGTNRADYDETIPQADSYDCPADKPIKGNAQSMIYHLPGGDFYERTKPEACFATEAEATAAGYRRSKR